MVDVQDIAAQDQRGHGGDAGLLSFGDTLRRFAQVQDLDLELRGVQ